jgi:hypothetical protein
MAPRWLRRQWINLAGLLVAIVGTGATLYSVLPRPVATPAQLPQRVEQKQPESRMPPVVQAPVPVRKLVAASLVASLEWRPEDPLDLAYCGNPRLESVAVNYAARKVETAACTATTCYVVSDPGRFEPNVLELYRWRETAAPPERYRATFEVHGAAFHKLSPYFEEAIVGWTQEGSGGYLDLRVLLWVDGSYRELAIPFENDLGPDGHFELTDLDGDEVRELIVRYGRIESKVEVFRFDDVLLTFAKIDESSDLYLAAGGRDADAAGG